MFKWLKSIFTQTTEEPSKDLDMCAANQACKEIFEKTIVLTKDKRVHIRKKVRGITDKHRPVVFSD